MKIKRLTPSGFNRAQRFLETEARLLERCHFDFHFNGGEGSRESVIAELKSYQNPDGGFGKALEPDVRMQDSSVVATKFALQILIDIQAPAQEKLVRDGIAYLLDAFDEEKSRWPLVADAVMEAPHAPWWDFEGLKRDSNAGDAKVIERLWSDRGLPAQIVWLQVSHRLVSRRGIVDTWPTLIRDSRDDDHPGNRTACYPKLWR